MENNSSSASASRLNNSDSAISGHLIISDQLIYIYTSPLIISWLDQILSRQRTSFYSSLSTSCSGHDYCFIISINDSKLISTLIFVVAFFLRGLFTLTLLKKLMMCFLQRIHILLIKKTNLNNYVYFSIWDDAHKKTAITSKTH